jgi:hypothetical protein
MNIKATPATTAMPPMMVFADAFSLKNKKPAMAANNGVVDDMGMACDAMMFIKL